MGERLAQQLYRLAGEVDKLEERHLDLVDQLGISDSRVDELEDEVERLEQQAKQLRRELEDCQENSQSVSAS